MSETFTVGQGLSKFDTGDNPGAAKLNANVTKIDQRLILPATGGFPSPYPAEGFVLRTDLNKLYQNTGTEDVPAWTIRLDGSAADATTSSKGIIKLAGDLAGTADSPTVPGLSGKAATSHTHAQSDVTGLVAALAVLAPPKYLFCSPDVLTTDAADNALIPLIPGNGLPISHFEADVKTAPTGASLVINFYVGTRSTGAIGSSIATVTITAGNFTASSTITPVTIATTEFLVCKINQVGSTIAGTDMTASAW